ncbi:Spy/CpxP family protein refolding chaperone [Ancylomarina sp. 16SWW S1-10-2]|uniref:Spy/CpxP family protein refolding chaperone n=1 Tax=Ancylomarina sp. 16SWW S1-10-2 TaxID=2499681 RepID=UPI0012AD4B5F|nr:periplasmic heavy metal sensor [Ancylomarina sp. 16SWW S1-10-2]MRT92188.1 periplasmic heavy metal sensor [Ancylomarina sp. 16SWW S1-10-2]
MKTKITTCIVVALMLLSGVSQAQKRNRSDRMQKTTANLTDAQKEELKAAKLEYAKATLDVRNELNELKAHQKTLMSAEKLDEKKVFENIDNMTALKKQLMKERINMRLATSGLLGADQQMYRNMRGDRFNMNGQQMNKGDKRAFAEKGNQECMSDGQNQKMRRDTRGDSSKMRGQQMKSSKGQMNKENRRALANKGKQRGINALDLSVDQQKQMKTIRLDSRKATQNLREEMQELRLKQKHLLNDEAPNKNEIYANIDQISKVQNQLAKERVLNQKEIRKVLDKDQLVIFLSKSHKMGENRRSRM